MGFYPTIWAKVEKPAPRYLLRLAMMESILDGLPSSANSILEVGPGRGDVAGYLHGTRPQARLTLCDSSEPARNHLRQRFQNSKRIELVEDLTALAADSFDVVMAFEVLEHIEDDVGFVQELLAPLRPGGTLVVSVPAYMKKWQHQDEWAGHVRRYEYTELIDLLAGVGVEQPLISDFGFPFMNLIQPLKFVYYRAANKETTELSDSVKTAASGVSRSPAVSLLSSVALPVLALFSKVQLPFRNRRLGDGFILVGTYRD